MKSGVGTVTIEEIDMYKESINVDETSYLFVLSVDGNKAKVLAWGKRVEFDSLGVYTAVSGIINMDSLILFHTLTLSEQRKRIEKSFKAYSAHLRTRKLTDSDIHNYLYESNFSPMREAFFNYWKETKDTELLRRYFAVVELNDGSADGGDSRALRDLFISDPETFAEILKGTRRDRKKYIKYRVSDAAGWVHPDERTEYNRLIEKHL